MITKKVLFRRNSLLSWNRINDLSDNFIIVDARIVNEDIRVSKDYTFSWLSSIEMLMKVTGYSQFWNNGNYSSKSFPNEFVKKMKSMFVDDWRNEMILKTSSEQAEQGKLSFYCKIKNEFRMGRYLPVIQNLEMRSYIAKFRISAHKFPIETGRYINTERQNRLCTLYERGIGDELHYFSKCNNALLKMCREKYISYIKKKGETFSLFNETDMQCMPSCVMMIQL